MAGSAIERHLETARAHRAAGRLLPAAEAYRKVLEKNANHLDALYELAAVESAAGRYDSTRALLERAVAVNPQWPQAMNDLGITLHYLGKHTESLECFRKAVGLAPGSANFVNNLANALRQTGDFDQAIETYRASLALDPSDATIHYNLAISLMEVSRAREAIVAVGKAISLQPQHARAHYIMGAALMLLDRWPEAAGVLQKSVTIEPSLASAHNLLGQALALCGRRMEAIAAYRRAIELQPDDEAFRFYLAAQLGDDSVSRAPDRFIRRHFDECAGKFDRWLVEDLKYRAPEALLSEFCKVDQRRELDILDLGCGTGLCGVQFKPFARKLIGVDLSSKMLGQAKRRGIYDDLFLGDLIQYLRADENVWDLIVAGDVLIYLGDLADAIALCSDALRPQGLLAFTLERHEGSGFHLQPSGRFSHSIEYVRELAGKHGFEELAVNDLSLREEAGESVAGRTIVLRKHLP